VGKTLLAHQSEETLNRIAQAPGFTRMTARTITALPQLRKELQQIRDQGYTIDQEEAVEGLSCVAGPIFNHSGQVVAAFSVAGPATRLTPARIPELAQMVRETSQQISNRLGYRNELHPLGAATESSPRPERGAKRKRAGIA
jgi:IclR family acetate operon transcriptional repressor